MIGVTAAATIAAEVLQALDDCAQIEPFTGRIPEFDLERAYAVAERLRHLRVVRGEKQVGRKIGFTNVAVWQDRAITAPIWGDVFDATLHALSANETYRLPRLPALKIEPEIVFKFARPPSPGMDERALLSAIEWVAHGIEIVHSIYPGWRFAAPDAVADGGLHAALLVGTQVPVDAWALTDLSAKLEGFTITLSCDGEIVDRGRGANVMGSPLRALKHLVKELGRDDARAALRAGEIVTTGTLTGAFPIAAGQRWTTVLEGIELDGVVLQTV